MRKNKTFTQKSMKRLPLLLLVTVFACQSKPKDQNTPPKDQYFFALYHRYIADSDESKTEFLSTQGNSLTTAKPHSFEEGVFFNGGVMDCKESKNATPTKYTVDRRDGFPAKIEIKIKNVLDFSAPAPLFKGFVAKKEKERISINAKTPLGENDHLILLIIDTNGKDVRKEISGPYQFPYTFSIKDMNLSFPASISGIYQQKFEFAEKNANMSVLLEYYAPELQLTMDN